MKTEMVCLLVLMTLVFGIVLCSVVIRVCDAVSEWNPKITIHVVHSGYIEERVRNGN